MEGGPPLAIPAAAAARNWSILCLREAEARGKAAEEAITPTADAAVPLTLWPQGGAEDRSRFNL